jgi:hypothetical protein
LLVSRWEVGIVLLTYIYFLQFGWQMGCWFMVLLANFCLWQGWKMGCWFMVWLADGWLIYAFAGRYFVCGLVSRWFIGSWFSCDDHSWFPALCHAAQVHVQKGLALRTTTLKGRSTELMWTSVTSKCYAWSHEYCPNLPRFSSHNMKKVLNYACQHYITMRLFFTFINAGSKLSRI